jgi:hypothetical protein
VILNLLPIFALIAVAILARLLFGVRFRRHYGRDGWRGYGSYGGPQRW